MHYQFVPYTIFLMASAFMTFALAVYGMRHRHALGTNILALSMLIGTLWSVANALEISALTVEHKFFWANLQYIAYGLGPAAWFLTTCQFTGRAHWVQRKRVFALLIVPALTIFLVWFDSAWGLVRTGFDLNTAGRIYVLEKQYGPWFFVHFAQAYALNFASIFLAGLAALNRNSVYRGQALFLLGGVSLVVASNLLYLAGVRLAAGHDLTPLVFSVAAGLMFWGIYRVDLFSLVPIARERVLEAMETGVIVVNAAGRVVDLNPACYRMFSIKAGVGALLKDISPELASLSSKEAVDQHQEITCRVQGEERYHKVAVSAITDQRGHVRGTVMAITDITALKQVQARLILEQQEAAIAQERARFTQDLHDNLGQTLAFSSVQVRAVRRELDRGNAEKANEYLRRLGEVLHQVQREMRDYVYGMRTGKYENTSLPVLLEKQANRLKEHGGFSPESVVLELPEHTFGLNEKVQICQIVKEAFNNILKHSSATRVWVQLQPGLENWVLSIRDNGVGFDASQVLGAQHGGFGLSILSERAKVLGGEVEIISQPGRTEIRVEFARNNGGLNHAHHDCR